MKWYERFYRDDKTGQYSDTTVRAWMVFALFFLYASGLSVAMIAAAFVPAWFSSPAKIDGSLNLLEILMYGFLGAGGLYLGKRFNEGRNESKRGKHGSGDLRSARTHTVRHDMEEL